MRACYDVHLPSSSLWYGYYSRLFMVGAVLPSLHSHVICKNWHLCWVCWEDCERKNSHVPTPS